MGIDIRMFAEVFDGERWTLAEPLVENQDHVMEDHPLQSEWVPQDFLVSRNRALFAILGLGWDVCSVAPYEPIKPCRGLPSDLSPELAAFERSCHDQDPFGHSWLSLEELLTFDWKGRIIQKAAKVEPDVAHLFKDNPLGFPCEQWPKGRMVCYGLSRGIDVRWRETYEQSAGTEFLGDVLTILGWFGSAENVRIVFWFDY